MTEKQKKGRFGIYKEEEKRRRKILFGLKKILQTLSVHCATVFPEAWNGTENFRVIYSLSISSQKENHNFDTKGGNSLSEASLLLPYPCVLIDDEKGGNVIHYVWTMTTLI